MCAGSSGSSLTPRGGQWQSRTSAARQLADQLLGLRLRVGRADLGRSRSAGSDTQPSKPLNDMPLSRSIRLRCTSSIPNHVMYGSSSWLPYTPSLGWQHLSSVSSQLGWRSPSVTIASTSHLATRASRHRRGTADPPGPGPASGDVYPIGRHNALMDPYAVLGVRPGSPEQEIARRVPRAGQALASGPRRGDGGQQRMAEINAAYDLVRAAAQHEAGPRPRGRAPARAARRRQGRLADPAAAARARPGAAGHAQPTARTSGSSRRRRPGPARARSSPSPSGGCCGCSTTRPWRACTRSRSATWPRSRTGCAASTPR